MEVEQKFFIETYGTERGITGYIDFIDDKGFIIDHKMSKRSYPVDKVEKDFRLTAYSMAYRSSYGKDASGVRLDVMVRNNKPKVQQLKAERTESDIERFLRLAKQVERGINAEVYYPNDNYTCGICGYKEMCEKW